MPHDIAPAAAKKKVVVVGAGPAGLEAARVAAERGHAVVVLEAAPDPGGQVRLAAQSERRREMISIIDWRMAQCAAREVAFHFNACAEAGDVEALALDVVIIATGGLPHTEVLESGNDLVDSTWDVIAGDVRPDQRVLVYDDAGDHPGFAGRRDHCEIGRACGDHDARPQLCAGCDGDEPRALHAQPSGQGRALHRNLPAEGSAPRRTFGVCGTCKVKKTAGEVHMVHNGGISEEDIEAG